MKTTLKKVAIRPAVIEYNHDPVRINIPVIWDRRTRRISLKFAVASGFTLRVPFDLELVRISTFLDKHKRWIASRVERNLSIPPKQSIFDQIWYRGNLVRIDCHYDSNDQAITVNENRIVAHVSGTEQHDLEYHIKRWMMEKAYDELTVRLREIAQIMKVRFQKVTIRNQKSRWGSCSIRGNINLNWRLIQLAPDVSDYVLIHELCHIVHMNHSTAFWNLVRQYTPNLSDLRKQLRRSSHLLR